MRGSCFVDTFKLLSNSAFSSPLSISCFGTRLLWKMSISTSSFFFAIATFFTILFRKYSYSLHARCAFLDPIQSHFFNSCERRRFSEKFFAIPHQHAFVACFYLEPAGVISFSRLKLDQYHHTAICFFCLVNASEPL